MSPEESLALDSFTDYMVRNYPGPNTIISDPKWHAPRIFRAALHALSAANAATLKAAQGGVTEAMVERARLAIMASDGFEPGSDGYINDSAIRAALAACTPAKSEGR